MTTYIELLTRHYLPDIKESIRKKMVDKYIKMSNLNFKGSDIKNRERNNKYQDSEQERAYKIKLQAEKQVVEEDFKERVMLEKIKIREYKSLWDRMFPWKIVRK